MPGISIEISRQWDEWIRGMRAIGMTFPAELAQEWQLAADLMYDRSQQYVHVITGQLKGSGVPPRMSMERGNVVAEVEYTAPYAAFEERRGGTHSFLQRAYTDVEGEFTRALGRGFDRVVRRWR